jgi:hypothetical protein
VSLDHLGLLVASAAFALISGANDGGTLLTVTLKMRFLPPVCPRVPTAKSR